MINFTKFIKAPKNKKELSYLHRKYYDAVIWLVSSYNKLILRSSKKNIPILGDQEFDEIKNRSITPTDINDHLETIFTESLSVQPKLIVELGVGAGESTFVFEKVAKLFGSNLVSIDLDNSSAGVSKLENWHFVSADDVEFADNFKSWAFAHNIEPTIDILFIDTSHRYEHTKTEIRKWFPFLSTGSKVFFHDSNVRTIYKRRGGTVGLAYDINRNVIRAIEDFFSTSFDESKDFVGYLNGWLIKHFASCNGLTIIEKIQA